MNTINFSCDTLVIGSGAAGLSLALRLASKQKVIVLSKRAINESSTLYAQGGIAAVFDSTDSIASHVEDTLIAGAGIVDKKVAEFIASNARHCIQWLIQQGVLFDTEVQSNGKRCYHLTREGGHSHRRILHVADETGKALETTLVSKVLAHPNIQVLEYSYAIDLILSEEIDSERKRRVIGAWIYIHSKKVEACRATSVVLATGGASRVYQYTTNPDIASGDGIAMAWRAGCRIANLEFNQFHPTALFHPRAQNFLLTEALRGEGAYLKRPDNSRFMPDFDIRNELAPRDIVARAIDYEMKRLSVDCMYLDMRHKPVKFIRHHFPMLYEKLLKLGIDLSQDLVPIVPAAHYTCGGVVVDKHGHTDINGLYAIGEVSYTGLHGANRMASNSLLECLVYGWSASEDILKCTMPSARQKEQLPDWNGVLIDKVDQQAIIQEKRHKLRLFMWDCVGIVRTTKRLKRALHFITALRKEADDEYRAHIYVSKMLIELRNLAQVAELIVRCAIMRKESRGLHYTLDYPEQLHISGPSVLIPQNYYNK